MRAFPDGAAGSRVPILSESFSKHGRQAVPTDLAALYEGSVPSFFDHPSEGGRGASFNSPAAFAYDAVWAAAFGIAHTQQEQQAAGFNATRALSLQAHVSLQGRSILQNLRNVKFQGVSGDRVEFSPEGDRLIGGVFIEVQAWYNDLGWTRLADYVDGKFVELGPIRWAGNSSIMPVDGTSCPEGTYFDRISLACTKCAPGSFAGVAGLQACVLCSAGTVCDAEGCSECAGCPLGLYQDKEGQSECTLCPAGTTSLPAAGSLDLCVCDRGFYRRDGQPGEQCFPCPYGGACDGAFHAPYPQMGFWGSWGLVPSRNGTSEDGSVPEVFFECDPGRCDGDCDGASARQGLRECRSEPSNLCNVGMEGRMCRSCELGYFSLGGQCTKCRSPAGLFVFGWLAAIIMAWIVLNAYASARYDAIDVVLLYLQVASMISTFGLRWHEFLVSNVFNLIQFVNFDIDFFSPQCLSTESYEAWSFWHGFLLQILLPVGVLAFLATRTLFAWARTELHARRQIRAARPSASEDVSSFYRDGAREKFSAAVKDGIYSLGMFMNTCYHTYTSKALSIFFCRGLPDGTSFLVAAPEITCWEGAHQKMIPVAVLSLLAFTTGVPAMCVVVLRYGRAHNLFKDPDFSRMFGWIYLRYEKDHYWWELVFIARRGFFCILSIVLTRAPTLQSALAAAALAAAIGAQSYARPFLNTSIDVLDSAAAFSLLLMVCAGLLFYDGALEVEFADWRLSVLVSLSIVLLFGFAAMAWIMSRDVYNEVLTQWLHRRLSGNVGWTKVHKVIRSKDVHKVGLDLSPETLARLEEQRSRRRESESAADARNHLEIVDTIEGRPLFLWLKLVALGASADKTSETAKKSAILKKAFKVSSHALSRIQQVNGWMQEVLANDGPVSYYSHDPKAVFYNGLLKSLPSLIDYLVACTPEEQVATLLMFRKLHENDTTLQDSRRKGKPLVPLYSLIRPVDRASFAYWLMHADSNHVVEVRRLLESMRQCIYNDTHEARGFFSTDKTFFSREPTDQPDESDTASDMPDLESAAGGGSNKSIRSSAGSSSIPKASGFTYAGKKQSTQRKLDVAMSRSGQHTPITLRRPSETDSPQRPSGTDEPTTSENVAARIFETSLSRSSKDAPRPPASMPIQE
mmetsp:Transcript_6814/g.23812  ORF Transcript_6814/g.23812 Transcript_6814/m.23812 type:complete len:1139 (-) Transcript_6814:31-3447(-)